MIPPKEKQTKAQRRVVFTFLEQLAYTIFDIWQPDMRLARRCALCCIDTQLTQGQLQQYHPLVMTTQLKRDGWEDEDMEDVLNAAYQMIQESDEWRTYPLH